MGCLESVEEKYSELEERIKQIFQADKYFVNNMETVSLTHAYYQSHLLSEFQYMESDKQTKSELRWFMEQLRDIDFVLVSRIFYEMIHSEKLEKQFSQLGSINYTYSEKYGQVATYTLQGIEDLRTDQFREVTKNTDDERTDEVARVKALKNAIKEKVKTLGADKVRKNNILFKLSKEYEAVLSQRAQIENDTRLRQALKTIIDFVNEEVSAMNIKKDEEKKAAKFTNITDYKALLYEKYWDTLVEGNGVIDPRIVINDSLPEDKKKANIAAKKFPANMIYNHYFTPEKNVPKDYREFTYKLYTLEYEKKEEQVKPKYQNSFERILQIKRDVSTFQSPEIINGSSSQLRYLDMSKQPDAFVNYAKFLENIAQDLSKRWQASYDKWEATHGKDFQDKQFDSRKALFDQQELKRKDFSVLKKERDAAYKKEQEDLATAAEAEATKIKTMNDADRKIYLADKAKEKENEKDKPRVMGDKNFRPIDEQIDENLAKYLNYIKINKNEMPNLDELELDNPNMFLEDHKKYWNRGLKMIAKGKVALVLMAGASDIKWEFPDEKTPLGFQPTGLNSGKCLIQLFCERVEAIQRLAHALRPDKTLFLETSRIHVYVMTNPDNDKRTRKLFRKHLNFGLWKANIHFFCQPVFPAMSEKGEIRLREKLRIHMMPDGTGGVFDALQNDETILQGWNLFGIKYVHIMGIDNLLGKPCDPTLLGMLRGIEGKETGVDVATKIIQATKDDATLQRVVLQTKEVGEEKHKVVKPSIVRVSELPDDADKFPNAVFNDFACTTEFIRNALDRKDQWETLHIQKCYIPFYQPPNAESTKGKSLTIAEVTADDQYSYVFERDVLDPLVIVHPKRFALLNVNRQSEYAPIKNKNPTKDNTLGTNTFRSAIVQQSEIHKQWLLANGYQFTNLSEEVPTTLTKKALRADQEYLHFIGEMSQEDFQKILNKREEKKNPKKVTKKPKNILSKALDTVVKDLAEDSSDGEHEIVNIYNELVEIDARASIQGENIPEPRVYLEEELQPAEEGDPAIKQKVLDSLPIYVKCPVRPIKWKLPWKLNQIYRYI